ncbi:uncharacterized protein BYT42DRAFT_561621 [Radiomyces spectabilis]|uniref:uncharacterized protein n=1 Tax=Radiomyces spectabilis TaxID=64574 RepID=UPI00221F4B28|nr:uncharacterized protein BYT42DRAFT_561621 [Radiomyces spectabilis]KAI8388889.1 hypothetical protein BYT42DRAFT_561621 [Radiomyces spectabilis]
MMSGHVVYACACLNVKVHLASKETVERHTAARQEVFVQLTEPPLKGWQFAVGMGGVVIQYNTLVRSRALSDSWLTICCLNCTTRDVYSVQRPSARSGYPADTSILSKPGDQLIIHDGCVFGQEIDNIKKRSNYSKTFGILLNSNIPPVNMDSADQDHIPGDLFSQHKQLCQVLEQSLDKLEQDTNIRIEQFKKEQELQLDRARQKSKHDRMVLWQSILEASRSVDEEQLERRVKETNETQKDGHVRFIAQEKSKTSNLKSQMSASSSPLRRASFALDTSFSMPASSSQPRMQEERWDERSDNEDHSDQSDSDNEEMFHLDEEIQSDQGDDQAKKEQQQQDSSPDERYLAPKDFDQRRRSSFKSPRNSKYLHQDEPLPEDEEASFEDDANTSNYATSVPIAISYPDQLPAMFEKNTVNPSDYDPTSVYQKTPQSARSINHGFSLIGEEGHLAYPSMDRRRKSIAAMSLMPSARSFRSAVGGKSLDTKTLMTWEPESRREAVEKLRRTARNSRTFEDDADDSEDRDNGPMIPPHILAENTFNDETEALFGAVPRSSARHRAMD